MAKEILIVDDEPHAIVPIQFLMQQQGYKVMIAERGEDALDRQVEIAKGLTLGADAYITKPFSNNELVAKVKEILEKTNEEAGE